MGPLPIPLMANMPTIATAYKTGLPVSISGITTNAHGRQPAQPTSINRRRPTRSDRLAEITTEMMLTTPLSAPTVQMKLREYPRWEWAYMAR